MIIITNRIIDAMKIDLKYYNKDNEDYNSNLLTSSIFIEYIKTMLENIPLENNLIQHI
jgi:hypothetical protein